MLTPPSRDPTHRPGKASWIVPAGAEGETAVADWFPPGAISSYIANKRFELESVAALDDAAACALYETIY